MMADSAERRLAFEMRITARGGRVACGALLSDMKNFRFSTDIHKFAKQIVWFESRERSLKDIDAFLVFVMARGGEEAFQHALEAFKFSINDFIKAFQKAKPGVFIYEEQWNKWNDKFGIDPKLPFPRKYQK